MIEAARALDRRAIVSREWADLSLIDEEPDRLAVGDVKHHALLRRVAAAVHHGGAGHHHHGGHGRGRPIARAPHKRRVRLER